MRNTFTASVVSLLILHLHQVQSENAEFKILHKWPQGFYGETVEDGWQVTLTYPKPVARLVAWNAKMDSLSNDKTVYVLKVDQNSF